GITQNADYEGNPDMIRFSCFSEATADNGNISADPMFINTLGDSAEWDLRLRAESPCIDAGTTNTTPLILADILGVPRPLGEGMDMGAYEFDPANPPDLLVKIVAHIL